MYSLKKALQAELSFFFLVPALLWQVLFLYMPLFIILYYSLSVDSSWGLNNYFLIKSYSYARILARSLGLAAATALITLVLAYPMVYYIVFHVRRWRQYIIVLLMVPFWINVLVLAYAWFFLLERNGLINSLLMHLGLINTPFNFVYTTGAALVVMVYCYLPFMIMSLYTTLEKLDERLLEASADLGASTWQTFARVTFPLSLSGIKTGLLLVFVPAFGEFAIPTLLGGSKFLVVGSLISYYFFVARNKGIAAAITVVAGCALFGSIFFLQKLLKGWCRTQGIQE